MLSLSSFTNQNPNLDKRDAEWFDSQQRPTVYHGTLNKAWVNNPDPGAVAKDELVNFFRRTYRTKGTLSDFHVDGDQCEVLFKGPGYEADATIDRETGKYDLTVSPFSLRSEERRVG